MTHTNSATASAESTTAHVAEQSIARNETLEETNARIMAQRSYQEVQDPRPDLVEDSLLWTRLLRMVWLDHGDHPANIMAALDYMRCLGLRLDTYDNGKTGYVMKPLLTKKELDKDGLPIWGDSMWTFEHDYKRDRDEFLLPHREDVMLYLKKLWAEDQEDL